MITNRGNRGQKIPERAPRLWYTYPPRPNITPRDFDARHGAPFPTGDLSVDININTNTALHVHAFHGLGPVCHAIRLTFFKFLAGHIRLGRTRGTRARVSRLGRLSRRPGAISATFTALSSFERGERVRERDAHGETGSRLSP
jgi:hypothetical protein